MNHATNDISKAALSDLRDRIFEAAETLKALPDKERAILRSGTRSHWPQVILSYWEAYGQRAPRVRRPAPSAREITRMEEALDWMAWLGRRNYDLMKAVWVCCGENRAPSEAGMILGFHRDTIRARRDNGLRAITGKFELELKP